MKSDCICTVCRPVVSIRENETDIVLELEMPGVDKETISVDVQGSELTILSKRNVALREGYTFLCNERQSVEYKRVFTLGNDIDKNGIKASYENGILIVTLMKSEESKPKKIMIA